MKCNFLQRAGLQQIGIPTILRSGVRKMMPKRVQSWVFIEIIILSLMKGWPNANVAKA